MNEREVIQIALSSMLASMVLAPMSAALPGGAPFSFRFILQPVLAVLLGVRDGRRDAKEGRPAYGLSLVTGELPRRGLLKEGLRAVAVPLTIGILLDGVVQWMVHQSVHLWHAVLVGALLVGLPYILGRGLANRLSRPRLGGRVTSP